ncbi:glycine cleavage system protein GcvH [Arcticibacter sp.]|jgi:glycine cleavage system H protein|uniref:glycine cleavage system protein GcvH n=1 Tax=Arcticibacter sp. TaxID=1872630 RepID=UPI00388F8C64
MNFPSELKYTADHEWVKLKDGLATIGITEFAQGELGDIVFVDIPVNDAELNQHDIFGSIEAVKTVSDLFMPVSGVVVELNNKLDQAPELVNTDPYGEGWMAVVSLSDPGQLEKLLTADEYKLLVGH